MFDYSLLTGTIGFFACFWFTSKIYSVVKVDWSSEQQKNLKPALQSEEEEKIFVIRTFICTTKSMGPGSYFLGFIPQGFM